MRVKIALPALIAAMLVMALAPVLVGFDFNQLEESVTEHKLDNGLTLLIVERHDAPVVSFVTMVNVGGVDDPKGYTGLAHMFEHMAFKGTKTLGSKNITEELKAMSLEDSLFMELRAEREKGRQADTARIASLETAFEGARESAYKDVDPNAFARIVEQEGGVGLNAGTSMDYTMYHVSYPSNRVELWMAMESERFLNPVLREIYKERDVIAEERRQRLESSPVERLLDQIKSTAYVAHPYHHAIVGHMSDIQNLTREEARAYFKKYYVPSNMVVAIVGDVKTKDVIKMADKYFGRLPAAPKPEPVTTVEPPQNAEKRVTINDPSQPIWAAAWHIPAVTDPDFPAVDALTSYLGQGRTSALYKDLVKEKKLAVEAGAFAGYPAAKYPSLALAYAVPTNEHTNAECEEQVFAQIDKLKNELLPQEEMDKIKARAKSQLIFGLANNEGLAMQLATYQDYFGDWKELFGDLDRINALTAQDIQRVARRYFNLNNCTIGTIETAGS
jgi:predicted Zn-dependent peptidase